MDGLWLDISDMELVDMGEPLDFLGDKKKLSVLVIPWNIMGYIMIQHI